MRILYMFYALVITSSSLFAAKDGTVNINPSTGVYTIDRIPLNHFPVIPKVNMNPKTKR